MIHLALKHLEALSKQTNAPVLPCIRRDSAVLRAAKAKQFLTDFDPHCAALQDHKISGK